MRNLLHFRLLRTAWSVPIACLGLGVILGTSQAIVASEFTASDGQTAAVSSSTVVAGEGSECVDDADLIVADLDEDESIGVNDLLILLAEFGTISGSKADINNDGLVDSADLIEILSRLNLDN